MKVLISDKLSSSGVKIFEDIDGIEVINEPTLGKNPEELKKVIADVDGIVIRSATTLTAEVLEHAKKLKVIGRAGIGVDNIDIPAASKQGIIVMNTPGSNVVTTAEHAISLMCALTRNIPQATASMKAGKWEKSRFVGSELYRKTLGVIGCGSIGKIVANRALGLQMKVMTFDPFLTDIMAKDLGVQKVEFDQLLTNADYITIHTPLNDKTKNLLNKETFKSMKKGVYIINCARGGIINEEDLAWALENELVAGAAIDVFVQEPIDPNHVLLKQDNLICTPHLGASTEEAQENVAIDIADQIVDLLKNGNITNALNVASATAEELEKSGPYIELGRKLGSVQGQLCQQSPQEIAINYYGEINHRSTAPISTAILQGLLQPMLSDMVINAVNAPYIAKERGIKITESKISTHSDYSSLIELELKFSNETKTIAGSIFGKKNLRIIRFNNINCEVTPEGEILIIQNKDVPGVVGQIGSYLGQKNVNISSVQLGLDEKTKMATSFFLVQGNVTNELLKGLKEMDGIVSIHKVSL
ncbi:phosphoglycerate dehydrogenase [bacterium K02(2017)]|nr:phosphoglycerate dehydrogenase [bacterium K02(2017)]